MLQNTPPVNHWWHTTLYVNARGLTTSLIPYGDGRGFEMEFDFSSHVLRILVTDGSERVITLEPKSVAAFYQEVMGKLDELGLATHIWPVPVEIEGAVPFVEDHDHGSYDPSHARRFWQALVQLDRVFREFRGGFTGKASPVHFFWGGFDLAVTRFSGRAAPRFRAPGAQLRPAGDGGGVLTRSEQRRLLAWSERRRSGVLVRVSRARRVP